MKSMISNSARVVFCLFIILMCSCKSEQTLNYKIDSFENIYIKSEESSYAFICLDQNKEQLINTLSELSKESDLSKDLNSFQLYGVDVSDQRNEIVSYIFQLCEVPILIILSPDKEIVYYSEYKSISDAIEVVNKKNVRYKGG